MRDSCGPQAVVLVPCRDPEGTAKYRLVFYALCKIFNTEIMRFSEKKRKQASDQKKDRFFVDGKRKTKLKPLPKQRFKYYDGEED